MIQALLRAAAIVWLLAGGLHGPLAWADTIRFAYDDASRVSMVAAPDGLRTRYFRDGAGRLTRTERDLDPGTGMLKMLVTHRRYDAADRLVSVANVLTGGIDPVVLAGQALTRDAGGAIREIRTVRSGTYDVATGTFTGSPSVTQSFDYDANGRLVAEVRSQGREVLATTYAYDAVGNRVSKTVSGPAGTEITSYSYTAADKLALETVSLAAGGSRATTYSWDGNGNLASKVEIGRATLYRFDSQSRLIDIREAATEAQARLASPKVRYAYDASGNRVSKWTAQRTDYLIDATYAHPQVLAEAVA